MQKWNGVIFIKISDYENIEDDIDTNNEKFKDIMYIYSQALKVVEQKINIIKYDYEYNEEYLKYGFSGYLLKPINKDKLFEIIDKYLK